MGTTYRSTLVNLLFESITMLERSVNTSRALLSHSMLFIAQCHSAVFFHIQRWPDLWFEKLLQGISSPSRSCTCLVLMLLYLSENVFHCQRFPSPSSSSPSLWNAGVLCYSVVFGHIAPVCSFSQMRIRCNFLHQLEFGAVAQLYPEA